MSSEPARFGRLRSAVSSTTSLASAWTSAKTAKLNYEAHRLQSALEPPDSWVEADGSVEDDRFQSRKAKRAQLEEYHDIRVDGGIVASLLEARGLMVFGVGGEFVSEEDIIANWLNRQFDQQDLLTLDIGTDALFYGYSLGEIRETKAGDFGKVELIEPWTTIPEINNTGQITNWTQEVKRHTGMSQENIFDPDDILHFNVMKASGRDPVGMSMLGRAMDEAVAYRDNQQAIQNAVTLHGFPKWHIKLGREGGAVIDDNELRRARPMFDNITELTKWVTGQDVDIETISPDGFEFESITEHDLSKLAIAFMLPVELTQLGGGDGLGTGFPARLRERLFLLSAQAQQNQVAGQLVNQLARPLLDVYSPFDAEVLEDTEIRYRFNDPITDFEEVQRKIDSVGDDMTVNERRNEYDLPPLDDDSVGEDFDSPGESGGGETAGLFQHTLADSHEDDWMRIYEDKLWTDETDEALLAFSESGVPEFAQERIREAILSGALFSHFEDIPGSELMDLRLEFADMLTEDGWTIGQLQGRLQDLHPQLEAHEAERIARTETQSVVNEAREIGYKERDDAQELKFKWVGPSDHRTTDTCEAIKNSVPEEGLPLNELQNVIQETAREHDHNPRKYTPHINCRHTFVRAVD